MLNEQPHPTQDPHATTVENPGEIVEQDLQNPNTMKQSAFNPLQQEADRDSSLSLSDNNTLGISSEHDSLSTKESESTTTDKKQTFFEYIFDRIKKIFSPSEKLIVEASPDLETTPSLYQKVISFIFGKKASESDETSEKSNAENDTEKKTNTVSAH